MFLMMCNIVRNLCDTHSFIQLCLRVCVCLFVPASYSICLQNERTFKSKNLHQTSGPTFTRGLVRQLISIISILTQAHGDGFNLV